MAQSGTISRAPRPSSLADVLDLILDKGLVIDAYVRVSVVGIELLTVDARVVVASVDTYLHFAEAVNRLDLVQSGNAQTLGDLIGGDGQRGRTQARRGEEAQDGAAGKQDRTDEREDDERGKDDDRRRDDEREPARALNEGGGGAEGEGEESEGKGLLSRIKERGQAF